MKNLQRGSVNAWLVTIIIILVAIVGYFIFTKKPIAVDQKSTSEVTNTVTNPSVSSTPTAPIAKTYSMSACGVTVVTKGGEAGSVTENSGQFTLNVDSSFSVNCSPKSIWQNLTIQQVLGINGSGSADPVSKNNYLVFDQDTRTNIYQLYSEKPAPLKPESELVGFSKGDWYYKFYFSNPSEAANQDSFVISVR